MIDRMMVPGAFWKAPYSHACKAGDFLFLTGQMPIDPATGEYVSDDIDAQTHQVMKNLVSVLEHAGMTLENVVSARAFLANIADYDAFNEIYTTYVKDVMPSRTCIGVTGLAGGALVEVDFIAYDGD